MISASNTWSISPLSLLIVFVIKDLPKPGPGVSTESHKFLPQPDQLELVHLRAQSDLDPAKAAILTRFLF